MKSARLLPALTLAVGIGLGFAINLPSYWGGSQSSAALMSPQASQLHGGNRGRHHAITKKKEDPVAAIADILKLVEASPENWRELQWQVYDRFGQMSADEIKLALTELHNSTELESKELYMLREPLLVIWSRMDGASCLDYLLRIKKEDHRDVYKERLIRTALVSWAHRDPHEAHEWLLEHQAIFNPGHTLESMRRDVISTMAEHNMAAAFHEIRQIPDIANRHYVDEIVPSIGRMAGRDAAARREFIELLATIEDREARRWGTIFLIKAWAHTDLNGALQHVSAQQPGTPEHLARERGLMRAWIEKDPEAALDWKVKNSGAIQQEGHQVIGDYLSLWAHSDPEAVNQWLAKQPEESVPHELYEAAMHWGSIAGSHPNYATLHAMKIQDEKKRQERLRLIAGHLRHKEWGDQWLEELEPQIRDEIAKALERDN